MSLFMLSSICATYCTLSLKAASIVLIIAIVLAATIFIILFQAAKSMGIGTKSVADYEKRIEIWNTPAGNSEKSKLDDMNIKYTANPLLSTISFATAIVSDKYKDIERTVDTFTYHYEVACGYESEKYDDQPYLIPYISEGSDCAVIVIPGGGFGYKSMDGSTGEGKDVAVTLQENGISAFVLHYRTNPYEYPIPYLDLQRAVRFLRYHAEDYGLDPDKISLIGFSAGGNLIGTYINTIQGNELFPADYSKDEIDSVNDIVTSAAMIYPALSFRYNVPMLFCMFDADEVRNKERREELLEQTDLWRHISSQDVSQFIAYGTKDGMVGMDETVRYIEEAKNAGCTIKDIVIEGADHGFGPENYMENYLQWIASIWE